MVFFNAIVGLIIGLIILSMWFFIKNKKGRLILGILAIACAIIATQLSERYLYPQYLQFVFESDIKKQPIFALIAKEHPQEFRAFINKVKKLSLNKKENVEIVAAYSAELMNKIFYQHLENASNELVYLYLKSTLELYRYLYTLNPLLVVKIETGDNSIPVDINALWQENNTFQVLFSHVLDTKKLIIEEPIKKLEKSEATKDPLTAVVDDLIKKFGAQIVKFAFSPSKMNLPAQIAAPVIIDFYAAILATGKENAGDIMRNIAHLKLQNEGPKEQP